MPPDRKKAATEHKETIEVPDAPESRVAVAGDHVPATRGDTSIVSGGGADLLGGGEAVASLPRVVLLQQMSAEVKRQDEPLRSGLFYNRLTKDVLGREIEFIPFAHYSTRVLLDLSKGLVCRSVDSVQAQMREGLTADGQPTDDCTKCVRKLWPTDRERETGTKLEGKLATSGPECSLVSNYFALWVNGSDPAYYEWIVLQFMRTSRKAAQDLTGLWAGSRLPLSAFHYRLTARSQKNAANQDYWVAEISRVSAAEADGHGGERRVSKRTTPDEIKAIRDQSVFISNKFSTEDLVTVEAEERTEGGITPEAAAAAADKHGI